jgi:DNA-binding transcriptional ArsR family regulator
MPRRNGEGLALLADPTRRRLIAALAIRPFRPSTLADLLELNRSTVSRQLRLLDEAGLVVGTQMQADGRAYLYRINPFVHGRVTAWLAGTDVGDTLDPVAAAGVPTGRRALADPWRAYRSGPRGSTFDPTAPEDPGDSTGP